MSGSEGKKKREEDTERFSRYSNLLSVSGNGTVLTFEKEPFFFKFKKARIDAFAWPIVYALLDVVIMGVVMLAVFAFGMDGDIVNFLYRTFPKLIFSYLFLIPTFVRVLINIAGLIIIFFIIYFSGSLFLMSLDLRRRSFWRKGNDENEIEVRRPVNLELRDGSVYIYGRNPEKGFNMKRGSVKYLIDRGYLSDGLFDLIISGMGINPMKKTKGKKYLSCKFTLPASCIKTINDFKRRMNQSPENRENKS